MPDGFVPKRMPERLTPRLLSSAILRALVVMLCIAAAQLMASPALAQSSQPRTVTFPSGDGKTTLTGYLFAPDGKPKTAPAVVLMHGRTGAYSPLAKGNYSAVTLSKSIRGWAELWAEQGYWALVVDSFGPRGYPAGALNGASSNRTIPIDEVTMRPLDAYGALKYLRASPRVRGDRVALEGWSNGGSAALASMTSKGLDIAEVEGTRGFRAAVALYPGCGLQGEFKNGYAPYAPVRVFIGSRDDEVSPGACEKLVAASKAQGGDIAISVFEGASHDFDDPARSGHSEAAANAAATSETRKQVVALFAATLGH